MTTPSGSGTSKPARRSPLRGASQLHRERHLHTDGRTALSASLDNTVRLWVVRTGAELRRFPAPANVFAAVFSPDGRSILAGDKDANVLLWRFSAPATPPEAVAQVKPAATRASGPRTRRSPPGRDRSTNSGGSRDIPAGPRTSPSTATARASSSAGRDQTLRLWNTETGVELRQFVGHTDVITGVALSVDGRIALSGSLDQTARLWDVANGRELHRSRTPGRSVPSRSRPTPRSP